MRDGPAQRTQRRDLDAHRSRTLALVSAARQTADRAAREARVNHDGALQLARGLNDVLAGLQSGKWGRRGAPPGDGDGDGVCRAAAPVRALLCEMWLVRSHCVCAPSPQ